MNCQVEAIEWINAKVRQLFNNEGIYMYPIPWEEYEIVRDKKYHTLKVVDKDADDYNNLEWYEYEFFPENYKSYDIQTLNYRVGVPKDFLIFYF